MIKIREPKWHDPFVLGACFCSVLPFMFYGMIVGFAKDLIKGKKHTACQQIKDGLTEEEIEILKKIYKDTYNNNNTNDHQSKNTV